MSEQPPPPPGYGTPPQPGYGTPPQPGYGTPPPGWNAPPVGGFQPPGGYPPPQGYQQLRGTNVLAIAALVSIFVFTPAALVLGIIARNQIKQTGEEGDGMALAGIIVGGIAMALFVLFLLFFVFAFATFGVT